MLGRNESVGSLRQCLIISLPVFVIVRVELIDELENVAVELSRFVTRWLAAVTTGSHFDPGNTDDEMNDCVLRK
jgi:hypothetical protein